MHEYEFRLVVYHPTEPFTGILDKIAVPSCHRQHVQMIYAKPHFRFRDNKWETKHVVSSRAVYHDGLWFRWVHSKETPYEEWCRMTHCKFLNAIGNFQDPFDIQQRDSIQLDKQACIYTFRDNLGGYRLVFEWEYCSFATELCELNGSNASELFEILRNYRDVYKLFMPYDAPPYELDETMTRKPVTCTKERPRTTENEARFLIARKVDGVFGLVISFKDTIKEKWEGHERYERRNVSLGNGIVFSAEKCDSVRILLDVYRVRGCLTASWSRRSILNEFLPTLKNKIPGYKIQQYVTDESFLAVSNLPTDGLVYHDVIDDVVYKLKEKHSLDVVYSEDGWFLLPDNKRFKCHDDDKGICESGRVYEVAMQDGRVVRKRDDRFTGNTAKQVEMIFTCSSWGGPTIEEAPPIVIKAKRRRNK